MVHIPKTSCKGCDKHDCPAQSRKEGEDNEQLWQRQEILRRLCQIKYKLIVLSGKGGVGKSTVAVNLALALADKGFRVGLMDVDIHGPSVPKLLNLDEEFTKAQGRFILPVKYTKNLFVMSIGFLLRERSEAVIWRGPMKMALIRQFIKDVEWGPMDFLVIDSPPGTGDEPLTVVQTIEDLDGAVVVTTPQDLAIIDVEKSLSFCKTTNTNILGIIENMSGFACPHCGETIDIFPSCDDGGNGLARKYNVPFLGRIPIDPDIAKACDMGQPYFDRFKNSETSQAFASVIEPVIYAVGAGDGPDKEALEYRKKEENTEQ